MHSLIVPSLAGIMPGGRILGRKRRPGVE